ncbi:MAG: glycoside hydrolase family 16 protein [Mediterranea sp.]|jgi:beta-glucanase (GH16 family)|nr:glycoside hydrolase family 16 protein [Mediterranea sp.]
MKNAILFLFLFVCSAQQACSSDAPDPIGGGDGGGETESQDVLFRDDFDTFDTKVWTKEAHPAGWVNQELQIYDEAHVSVGKDGDRSVLILTAERKAGGAIYSGRVNSKGKKSFRYGKVEASIKLPSTANGLWPAFWMMGEGDKQWPACGEIDILEMGERGGISAGTQDRQLNVAIHYGPSAAAHEQQYYTNKVAHSLQDGKYHTYRLEWDAKALTIYVDGARFHAFDISQNTYFHDNFYLLLNLAVGGSFTGITNASGITALPEGGRASMYVDWIKIFN